jgi:hypothetical protein
VLYLHSNGWLDTTLNADWEVNAFQFYAGDLFDLINNLQMDFNPRTILSGDCVAQKDNLRFYSSREFDSNTYALHVDYKCSLKGLNSSGIYAEVVKFTASTRLSIVATATASTLSFKIFKATIDDLSFQTVGKYTVNNLDLAEYRATQILSKVENTFTFGTGFPTIPRELPKTRVDQDWVFYYDNSHIDASEVLRARDL